MEGGRERERESECVCACVCVCMLMFASTILTVLTGVTVWVDSPDVGLLQGTHCGGPGTA